MLEEYWFDDENKLKRWSNTLLSFITLSIKVLMSIWILVKRIVVAPEWIFASKKVVRKQHS